MSFRICHLTSAHPSNDIRVFRKECTSLAKAGYEVYLVAQGDSRVENDVQVVGQGPMPGRLKRILSFTKTVYQAGLDLDCDLYHIHDPELLPFALKLKKQGKAVIFDSHEMTGEQIKNKTYLNPLVRNVISGLYRSYEKHVMKKLDAVIFPCTYKGRHPFENDCKLVETVDNLPMLDDLYYKYDPDAVKDERSACYVGSLSENRGVTNFIKAAYKIGAKANIGGPFDTEQYEKELTALPEYSCVNYEGILDRQGIVEILQRSVVGMANLLNVGQYNKYDNLATKVYEYMSLAMPVILTESPYNREVMDEYKFGVCVDPDNVDEIAQTLEYIFDNPEEAERMGKNGRDAVINVFNWNTEEKKLLDLYKHILG